MSFCRFVWALIPPIGGDFAQRRGAAKMRGFGSEARWVWRVRDRARDWSRVSVWAREGKTTTEPHNL